MQEKKPIFNGHTWVVAVVAIICLTLLGGAAMGGLIYIDISTPNQGEAIKLTERTTIGAIPIAVVRGIIKIVDRLTFVSKEHKK